MKKTLLLFISLIAYIGFSQTDLITIVDSETKENIPFASLYFKTENKGFLCDFEGTVEIETTYNNSNTCIVKCIGYEDKTLTGKELFKQKKIELTPLSNELNEVLVFAKKAKFKTTELGINSNPKSIAFDHFLTGKTGEIKAVWIPNEKSINGYLKNIHVYITEFGHPDAFVRLHIYSTNLLEIKPDKELLSENIVISGGEGNNWINIELEHLFIPISENGFFVGIE